MPTISSAGVGSGLDVTGIINQLMAVESRPLTLLKNEATDLKTQVSGIGKLQSFFSTLRDSANGLTSLTLWNQTTATPSDPTAVSVSTSNGAAAGSFAVQVQNLASGQTATSRTYASSADVLSAGSLLIELGTWVGDPATGFTGKAGSVPVTVNIVPGQTSLAQVRDQINAANAGVTASIINDATGARLSIRSTSTGAENAFRITATETAPDGDDAAGLSALGFDAMGASPMTRHQTAVNARATINGIDVVSASNTLSNVSDGMTVTLLRPTTTPVAVEVAPDKAAVQKAVEDFVKSFNDLAGYIRDQTKYDPATKKGGPMQGDRTVISMQNQLRSILNEESTGSSVFTRLSDVGIVMKADGTLETKSSKLTDALNNLPELRRLFAADGANNASSGFMQRYKRLADQVLGVEGSIETRNASLTSQIKRNDTRQEQMNNRLTQVEARLRKQYEALDANMGKLNALSSYVSQQMAMLNKSI